MSLISTINAIVADILNLDEDEVKGDLSPETAESWDSMAHLTIVTAIEEECGIKLTMDEVQSITCVNDIHEVAQKYVDQ